MPESGENVTQHKPLQYIDGTLVVVTSDANVTTLSECFTAHKRSSLVDGIDVMYTLSSINGNTVTSVLTGRAVVARSLAMPMLWYVA